MARTGAGLEELVRAYFARQGFFALRGVSHRFEEEEVTDIDAWLYGRQSASVRTDEGIRDEPAQHHQVALGEVDHLGRLVDENEAQRDQAVHTAEGNTAHPLRTKAEPRRRCLLTRQALSTNHLLVVGLAHPLLDLLLVAALGELLVDLLALRLPGFRFLCRHIDQMVGYRGPQPWLTDGGGGRNSEDAGHQKGQRRHAGAPGRLPHQIAPLQLATDGPGECRTGRA
jgi:hypothetical protein